VEGVVEGRGEEAVGERGDVEEVGAEKAAEDEEGEEESGPGGECGGQWDEECMEADE